MPSIANPLALLVRALRAFFAADLRLRRSSRGLVVEFDDPRSDRAGRVPPPAADRRRQARAEKREERDARELRQIRTSVATLLDAHRSSRHALRHLAFMAQAIERDGLRAIDKVPYDVLQRSLEQLEALVSNWADEGLAALRSKMAVALSQRERPQQAAPAAEQGAADIDDDIDASAPLSHPIPLDGEDAAEAEAALLAAYGSMMAPEAAAAQPHAGSGQPVH